MGVGGCAGLVFYQSDTNLDESGRREHQLRNCFMNQSAGAMLHLQRLKDWLQFCGEVGMLWVQRLVTLSWAILYALPKPHTNIL